MLKQIGLAAALCTAAAAPGWASTIDLTAVAGVWQNVVPGDTVGLNGQDTHEIRWGTPQGGGQSGYNFTAAAVPQDLLSPGVEFTLGTFTHYNFPISQGTSITGAQLKVDFSLAIPSGGGTFNYTALFDFDHFETLNNSNPCDDGGANGVGVNIAGCADSVTISTAFTGSDAIVIGDETYYLTITGFGIGGSGLTYWTEEGATNTTTLFAKFINEKDIPDDNPSPVPLPAAGFLLLGALGGLGALSRRRRRDS